MGMLSSDRGCSSLLGVNLCWLVLVSDDRSLVCFTPLPLLLLYFPKQILAVDPRLIKVTINLEKAGRGLQWFIVHLRLEHPPRPGFGSWVFYIYVFGLRWIVKLMRPGIRPAKACLSGRGLDVRDQPSSAEREHQ